jgi:hypothetical protein
MIMAYDMLKESYHGYFRKAEMIPKQMRLAGIFSIDVLIVGENKKRQDVDRKLSFNQNGTVTVNKSNPIPITDLDKILASTYEYNGRPTSLDGVTPISMKRLYEAIVMVEKKCEEFSRYREPLGF